MLQSFLTDVGPLLGDYIPKALLAIVCGGLIGVEREMKQKPAGFRTNILICVGSALFMWLSVHLVADLTGLRGDPGRIAAQVVAGVGFLGAGTILHSRGGNITGLTSAAMIWVVSAIGMAIGAGQAAVAIFTTGVILMVQVGLGLVERRLFGRCRMRDCEIAFDDDRGLTRKEIEKTIRATGQGQLLEATGLRRAGDHHILTLQCCAVHPQHKKFIGELWKIDGVREVKLSG